MQIQKGLVKYKDRSDIVCTYGITEDNKQYYFIDNGKLSNGNVIATTVLVEAIDPTVVSSSIGVIDSEGKVLIPFENKSIKVISDQLLLVEKAKPITESVIEAVKLRNDPLAATRLVTTPAAIKDKMNAKMGHDGRFVFNDQFSEASIFDMNGNNLLQNEYFSFIGITKDKLYYTKNTVDSEVLEYSLFSTDDKVEQDYQEVVEEVPLKEEVSKLDVSSTSITKDVIEQAINEQVTSTPKEANDNVVKEEDNTSEEQTNKDSLQEENVSDENISETEVEVKQEENPEDSIVSPQQNIVLPEEVAEEVTSDSDRENDVDNSFGNEENMSVNVEVEKENSLFDEKDLDKSIFDTVTDVNQDVSFDLFNSNEEVASDVSIFGDSILKEDSILATNDLGDYMLESRDDSFENDSARIQDTIIEDAADTMATLIEQNRKQRELIGKYRTQIDRLNASRNEVVEKAKNKIQSQTQEIKSLHAQISDLKARNHMLDNKVHEQNKIISSRTSELEVLRTQVQGKKELVRVLQDAQSLLDEDFDSSQHDSYYKQMAA